MVINYTALYKKSAVSQSCPARWYCQSVIKLTVTRSRLWLRFLMAGIVVNSFMTTIWITSAPLRFSTHRELQNEKGCFCSHYSNEINKFWKVEGGAFILYIIYILQIKSDYDYKLTYQINMLYIYYIHNICNI